MLMVNLRQTLILLALLGLPTTVLAQASTRVSTATETRCQKVSDNVAKRTATYQQNLARHQSVLDAVHLRLVGVVGRADARGYDVTKLTADQANLEQQTSKIQTDYQALITSLANVSTTCAAPTALAASVADLHTLSADLATTRQWITLTLRDDITQLKNQVKK